MTRSAASSAPTFVRWQLGARLRDHRLRARKSVLDVDAAGIVSDSTLWRIESGLTSVKSGTVKELCDLYGVDPPITESLVALARGSRGAAWFEAYGDAVPSRLELYLGAEQAATRISAYDNEVIFGTLQTPEYAAALFRGEHPEESSARIDFLVQVRTERQEQFWEHRPSDAVLCVMLGEAALARQVGGRKTMKGQVEHLRELDGQRGVQVRILPWSVGSHPAIYGGFAIFDFPEAQIPPVVYVESYTGGQYLPTSDAGRTLTAWERAFDLSVPIEEYRS